MNRLRYVLLVFVLMLAGTLLGGGAYLGSRMIMDGRGGGKEEQKRRQADEETEFLLSDEESRLIEEQMEAAAELILPPAGDQKDIFNLLLIGLDRRDDSWEGNSDTMILISVNKPEKSVKMISFMRDLYADIPGAGVRKLNAATALGGPSLLLETLRANYKVEIDNYLSVDFLALIDIVDRIGGVDLTISEEEKEAVNHYIADSGNFGVSAYEEHVLDEAGSLHLDGIQALAYARNRSDQESDYGRTKRQRKLLSAICQKCRTLSAAELASLFFAVLPDVNHDIGTGRLASLAASLPELLEYDLSESRIPYDGLYLVKNEILIPDMAATIERLHRELYGIE
ncbi:MAG: LCP family protein [Lachnospiraceae bacterium]|nr:LCP family protein [Lachnospiraceae bacterium]